MYLIIVKADECIEESNENKYLVFVSTDENKKVLAKFAKLWDEIKYLINTICGCKTCEYGKDFMKSRFESDDNLPLGRILKLRLLAVIVRSVFEDIGKYYLKMFLDECLHEL